MARTSGESAVMGVDGNTSSVVFVCFWFGCVVSKAIIFYRVMMMIICVGVRYLSNISPQRRQQF